MAFVLADRVKESCSAPGTGTVTLLGAATGYQSFSAGIGANNTTYYTISDQGGANWEVGYGTIGAGGTTLARTTVLSSSNGGSLVNFSSGSQDVFCDYPAGKAVIADSANALRVDGQSYVNYESAPGTTVAAGRMWYDNTLGNWNLGMGGGNITQQVGEELFIYGKASAAITDSPLQIIYHTGVVGASGVVTFAPTVAGITDENAIIGVATESIALNGFGRITAFGVIHGITTNGTAFGETWANDDVIWYNPVTGNPTNVKPVAPNIKFQIGIVINAGSGGSGSFQVLLQSGTQLGGTDSNVQLTSPTAAQLLTYSTSSGYWKNTSLAAGIGISVGAATSGVLTVTNSAPSQWTTTGSDIYYSTGSVYIGATTPEYAEKFRVYGNYSTFDNGTFKGFVGGGTTLGTATASDFAVRSDNAMAFLAGGATERMRITTTGGVSFGSTGTAYGTSGQVLTSAGNAPPTWTTPTTGTVTSVSALTLGTTGSDLSSTVANSTTTPVITLNVPTASASNRGALSAADWTTFNSKAPSVTYTTNYVPYGQGTTTPALASNFTFDGTTQNAPVQRASNGIVVNSKTVSANYTIASGDSAMSAGPITVASGITVTVASGSRWVVL